MDEKRVFVSVGTGEAEWWKEFQECVHVQLLLRRRDGRSALFVSASESPSTFRRSEGWSMLLVQPEQTTTAVNGIIQGFCQPEDHH